MTPQQAIREHFAATFTTLPYLETVNANPTPADRPSGGFCTIEFTGGAEAPASFGNPGANVYRRTESAIVALFTPVGKIPAYVETMAALAAAALRSQRLVYDSPASLKIRAVDPPGASEVDGRFLATRFSFSFTYDVIG